MIESSQPHRKRLDLSDVIAYRIGIGCKEDSIIDQVLDKSCREIDHFAAEGHITEVRVPLTKLAAYNSPVIHSDAL